MINLFNKNDVIRVFIASIASILSVFVTMFLIGIIFSFFGDSIYYYDAVLVALGFSLLAAVYATGILLLWGLPFHLLLSIFKMRSSFAYVLIGALGGPVLLLIFRPFGVDPIDKTLVQMFIFYCFGILASLVFWFFAVRIQTPSAKTGVKVGK
jgi:hypothetical protein